MRVDAISSYGAGRPPYLQSAELVSLLEMLSCINRDLGPILRLSSYLGSGGAGGGSYSGYAELYDLDGIIRETYLQKSLEPKLNESLFGGGKGFDLISTMLSSAGEAVERTVAALVSCSPVLPSERRLDTYTGLIQSGRSAIDPESIGIFSEAQHSAKGFLFEQFTRDTVVQWVQAARAISRQEVWVPSQLVDMMHMYEPGEEVVGYPASGGLSCHTSFRGALYHSITEVIERDAINVGWYTDRRPFRVETDDCPDPILRDMFESVRVNHSNSALLYHPSSVTSSPTFSLIGLQDWYNRFRYCAGGGCDYFARSALRKALVEFGQSRGALSLSLRNVRSSVGSSVDRLFGWAYERPLAEMTLFFQAMGFYGLPEYSTELDYYFDAPEMAMSDVSDWSWDSPTPCVEALLEGILTDLEGNGIDPIVLDYSHPNWSRLSIVKVWIPQLVAPFVQSRPMFGQHSLLELRPELLRPDGKILPIPYP